MELKHFTAKYPLLNLIYLIQIFYYVIIKTAKNYDYKKKIEFKDEIDVQILDPFAGIHGEDLDIIFNSIAKDKKIALDELNFSVESFDQLDVIKPKKQNKFLKKNQKKFSFSYKTSTDYFDIHFYWAGKLIKSVKRVTKSRARVALVSLRGFVKSINTQIPDLNDPTIKIMYEESKYKHKPKNQVNLNSENYYQLKMEVKVIGRIKHTDGFRDVLIKIRKFLFRLIKIYKRFL